VIPVVRERYSNDQLIRRERGGARGVLRDPW